MTTTYKEGSVLFKSEPFVYVLSSRERSTTCDYCLSKGEKLQHCSACRLARYCNRTCQRSAWPYHKYECACLSRVAPQIPTDSVRLMYRLLLKLQKFNGFSEKEEVLGETRCFEKLISHAEEIKQDMKRMEEFVQFSQTLALFAGDTLDLPTSNELLDIFGKMIINSFSICDPEMRPIGVGLYLGASLLDHSCCPNVVVVFTGRLATVRCIKSFRMNKEGPVLARISYVDLLQTTQQRRLQLKSQYYFHCDCERCTDVERDQLMLATCCPESDCSGCVVDANGLLTCLACGKDCSGYIYQNNRKHSIERVAENIKLIKQLQSSQEKSGHDILEKCEKCLSGYEDILHKNNIYSIQLKEMAFDCCIDIEQWQKALILGQELLIGYRQFYDTYHPMVGIHLMKLGKLSSYLSMLNAAKDYLLQAQHILLVTHGRDSSIYMEFGDLLSQLTAEIGYNPETS